MRKLLLFFAMLSVSIGAWAANIGGTGDGTVYLTGFNPGDLSIVLSGGTPDGGLTGNVDYLKDATKIYFGDDQGSLTLSNADLAALSKCTSATQLDMAKAKLEEGADITNLASTAEYIELPFGTYTKVQFEGLTTGNSNLKFAAALTSKGEPEDYTGYSYQAGNLKNFADQGLMSVSDLSNANTVVTLYGELNSTDLGNLNNVLHVNQKVTDISEATVTDLTGVNGKMDSDQFLIIPQNISTSWNDEWPNYSLSSTEGYPHFGFYTDNEKKKLCVHTGEATKTVGSDLANLYDFVDETMTLSILPDMTTDGSWSSWLITNNDVDTKDNYLNALKDLKLGCLDLSWFNLSGLGTNFSNFTNVSHLVLPNNNNNYDFASSQYSFPANVKTVADYTCDADHAGTQFTLDGQYYNLGTSKKATAVYVRQAGSLAEAHQLWPSRMFDIDDYYLAGQISNDDVAALSNQGEDSDLPQVNATTVDMHHAYMSSSTLISGYANSAVEYLALPDRQGSTINATSATTCAYYPACTNLKCVASYDIQDNKLYTFSTEVGKVKTLTDMIRPKPSGRYTDNTCNGLANIVMSGKLNHDDINQTTSTDASQNYGLSSADIVTADLKWAVFPNQDDMCFNTAGGYENLTTIQLPITEQIKLPDHCFDNCSKLPEVCIPGTYQYIGREAFKNCKKLTHITTTLVSTSTGFENDMGANTITLPPALKNIGTGAFFNVVTITDVYVTTPNTSEAPECEQDAFGEVTYWGYNTLFDGGRDWSRVRKTENGVITAALAYLHWPATEDLDRNKIYTDVTREYSIKALDTVTDSNGDVIYFPSQNEMIRSYVEGKFGYTWEAWGNSRNTYTSQTTDNPPVIYYDIINPNGVQAGSTQSQVDAVSDDNYTFDKKYAGWHQFVLSANFAYQPKTELPVAVKENDWYTICVPYDLTKSDLLSAFGAEYKEGVETTVNGEVITEDKYPEVVTLMGVKRDKSQNLITLQFTHDLVANNQKWDFTNYYNSVNATYDLNNLYKTQTDADPVIIEKGKPYLIKPYLSEEDLEKLQEGGFPTIIGQKQADQYCTPYDKYIVYATSDKDVKKYAGSQKFVDKDDVEMTSFDKTKVYVYHFIGTFEKKTGGVPMNTYYFSKSKTITNRETGTGKHMFFRHTMEEKAKTWSAYSCIIAPKDGGFQNSWDQTPTLNTSNSQDDSFPGVSAPAKYMMSFDAVDEIVNGETTGLESMSAVANSANGKVYNMNGQCVGNSLEGLSKGLYIMNGKKVIIK